MEETSNRVPIRSKSPLPCQALPVPPRAVPSLLDSSKGGVLPIVAVLYGTLHCTDVV